MSEPLSGRAKTARDVMRPVGTTFRESDDAWNAARRLFEEGQTGAAVEDAAGQLVGVVSQADMAAHLREKSYQAPDFYAEPDRDPLPARPSARVGQLMSRVIVQVAEDTPLEEIERHMLRRRVQRVFVVREGRAVGVVSALDVLRAA